MKKPTRKTKVSTFEYGYVAGPYDNNGQGFELKGRLRLERSLSPMKLLNYVKPVGSSGWRLCAWREGVYWEWRRRSHGGYDNRLVARIVRVRYLEM